MIEQALYGGHDAGGYRFLARSPGFADEWLSEAEQLCTGFGERPVGVACPLAIFAQPLGRKQIAIVQVADQGHDDAGRPGALAFRLLVLPRAEYEQQGGDPFALAEAFPPSWGARGELPALPLPPASPHRMVEEIRRVLQRPDGPNLLGSVQILVDGGRLIFERPVPDAALLRDLWLLLPTRTRGELWPASFAFGNRLGFHVLVVPPGGRGRSPADFTHHVPEAETGDYPEGRYELRLQLAAEEGDQTDLDQLFARRSRRDTIRLGLLVLVIVILLPLLVRLLAPPAEPEPTRPQKAPTQRAEAPPAKEKPALELPPPEPALTSAERGRWLAGLQTEADRLGVTAAVVLGEHPELLLPGATPLSSAVRCSAGYETQLLALLDARLGKRDARPLADYGPSVRQLRVLLWKHGVAGYGDAGRNPTELLELLHEVVSGTLSR